MEGDKSPKGRGFNYRLVASHLFEVTSGTHDNESITSLRTDRELDTRGRVVS